MLTDNRRDDAIAWLVRLRDPAASGDIWANFTDWLDADPANAEAYDAVSLADAKLSDVLSDAPHTTEHAFNDNEVIAIPWYRRRGFLAVAASAVLAVTLTPALLPSRDLETIATKPGETREINLSDGSQITLNGGTKLLLDRKAERYAKLEAGEAVFTVRHDTTRPFVVETGNVTLQDIGTVFNVRQGDDGLDVAVAEGAVQYNPSAEALTVPAGNRLQIARDRSNPILTKVDPSAISGWRHGRLTYHEAQLSSIALDLSRTLGTTVKVSEAIANRRFSGVIHVDRDQKLLFRRLESLLDVHATHSANGWKLTN